MPRRNPDGTFAASPGSADLHTFVGRMVSSIAAADLGGGTVFEEVIGSDPTILDFTQHLDSGEIFEAWSVQGRAVLALPTTATAESSAYVQYAISGGTEDRVAPASPTVLTGQEDVSNGSKVSISRDWEENDSVVYVGDMAAEASLADTTNGLAGGADHDADEIDAEFADTFDGIGPQFDSDDELTVPHTFDIRNVSDHDVIFGVALRVTGPVREL